MTLPPPPAQNKLQACISRFVHQLERTQSYLELVLPVFPDADDDPNRQYCLQTIVLMTHTFMEEYFRSIVTLGTMWNPDDVRRYMASRDAQRAAEYEEMPSGRLGHVVARAMVSFGNRAAKLKGILGALTTSGPFANDWAEEKCLDLVAVRNIITHQGGWPTGDDVPHVRSTDVIAKRAIVANATFYELRIGRQFVVDVLAAVTLSTMAMEQALNSDPRYRL